ncbi:MAG: DUF1549 domain-containing protein, partial [Pirellulales bacterium]
VPDFQKHVTPLLGRLGCNGRSCHGSFQGRGGFMLSLFGYDFNADLKAMLENGRTLKENPLESLVLTKPVDESIHEGGKRFEKNGWEYWVIRKWIEGGAKGARFGKTAYKLEQLEVTPREIVFTAKGERIPLKVVAHWNDGVQEDVTSLCRFFSNDTSIASIDERGNVFGGETGDTHVVVAYDKGVVPIPVLRPRASLGSPRQPVQLSKQADSREVDRLVQTKLDKLNVVASETCNDSDFIRRVSLDIAGTLPTSDRVRAFLASQDPDKRTKLIEELLQSPGYAGLWATFFSDVTGNNDEQLNNFAPLDGRVGRLNQQWYQWIYERIENNVPYDKMVEGIVTAVSKQSGESYRDYCQAMTEISKDPTGKAYADRESLMYYWARRNQRTSEERAIGFAYAFLGVRIQCAQCHKHPFDQWSKTDFEQFERLFDGITGNQGSVAPESKEEYASMIEELDVPKSLKGNDLRKRLAEKIKEGKVVPYPEVFVAKNKARNKEDKNDKKKGSTPPPTARLLGGDSVDLSEVADPRKPLMDWLRRKDNPYFAKAVVNRVWAHYFDVGIVNPPDDMNLANAPSNAELLRFLADQFVEHGYDLKWLHRTIANSETYQRTWKTNDTNELDRRNFSHALLKRLPAEVAYDSIQIAIRNDEEVQGMCNFTQDRALSVGGASPRNNQGGTSSYALSVFGRSTRETNCDCDRSNDPSLLQTVFVRNDSDVLRGLRDPNHGWLAQISKDYLEAEHAKSKPKLDEARERKVAEAEKQLKDAQSKLAAVLDKGKSEQIKKAEQRVEQAEKALKQVSDAPRINLNAPIHLSPEKISECVEEAYLRTLSRFPTESEVKVASKAVKEAENSIEGLSDVLWALINTKEFILNH